MHLPKNKTKQRHKQLPTKILPHKVLHDMWTMSICSSCLLSVHDRVSLDGCVQKGPIVKKKEREEEKERRREKC